MGEDVLDADTIASAENLVCLMYKTSEDSSGTWLMLRYLGKSVAQKSYHCLATHSSNTSRDATTKPWCGARRTFRNWCFRTQRNRLDAIAEDLLVPVFMTVDPIPKACLEMVSCRRTIGCVILHCKCRKVHVTCTKLSGCNKTDANCCIILH